MREPHITDWRRERRAFWEYVAWIIGAPIAIYVVLPYLLTHPAAGCVAGFLILALFAVAACMRSSQISRLLGE